MLGDALDTEADFLVVVAFDESSERNNAMESSLLCPMDEVEAKDESSSFNTAPIVINVM